MASEMEMRHRERDMLFRLLRAKKFNEFDKLIVEYMAGMEQEDVKLVKQQLTEIDAIE